MIGFPIFGLLSGGWDKHTWQGRSSGIERWNPTSRQKRARYGAQVLFWGKDVRALMGLRPVFTNPRTPVRTWGTQTKLCEGKNG